MDFAIHLLIEFGEAYSFGVEYETDNDIGTFRSTTHTLLELITGKEPSADDVDSVFPSDEHADELPNIAISQLENPPPTDEVSSARALLIEFGVSYWFASKAKRHDPCGYLISSTQVLLYLLTGKKALLPEHIEEVAPHYETLSDA